MGTPTYIFYARNVKPNRACSQVRRLLRRKRPAMAAPPPFPGCISWHIWALSHGTHNVKRNLTQYDIPIALYPRRRHGDADLRKTETSGRAAILCRRAGAFLFGPPTNKQNKNSPPFQGGVPAPGGGGGLRNLPGLKTFRKTLRNHLTPAEKLAVELDGEGHNGVARSKKDQQKDLFLRQAGILVLRFENQVVCNHPEGLLAQIRQHFSWNQQPPRPSGTPP